MGSGPGYVPACLKGLAPYQQRRQPWSPLPPPSRVLLLSMLMPNHCTSLLGPLIVLLPRNPTFCLTVTLWSPWPYLRHLLQELLAPCQSALPSHKHLESRDWYATAVISTRQITGYF